MLSFMLWNSFASSFLTTVAALNCDTDLSTFSESAEAVCDSGCDSCNFSLLNSDAGDFQFGKIYCLSYVPCWITVDSGFDHPMYGAQVFAQNATELTIITKGTAVSIWYYANIYAPRNGGDFRFEGYAQGSVVGTNFHASDSGLIDFLFSESGSGEAELSCMKVLAANARKLSITLGENTKYGGCVYPSHIECPVSSQTMDSACIWQSDASPSDEDTVVDIIAPSGTPQSVSLICENSEACTGVEVHCHETDVCLMQYSDGDWFCNGQCNISTSTGGIPMSTKSIATSTSTSATEQMTSASVRTTTSARTTPSSQSGNGSNGNFLLYVVILCLCVVIVCGALVLVCRKVCGKQQVSSKSEIGGVSDQQSDIHVAEGFEVIVPGNTDLELERSPLVIQKQFPGRRSTEILICEQPEGVPDTVLAPPMPQRRAHPYVARQIEGASGDPQSSDELLAGAVTHGLDESEERRDLKDAIYSVDQMKRDAKDVQFGKYLSSVKVGNEILEEDVFDEIGGVEPTPCGPQK